MRVLIHLSHHDPNRTDGWSGAPGEAVWVQDLVARMIPKLTARGISTTTVNGDMKDYPEYHQDYDAFIAPHYEADVHGFGGWLWGRAANSTTSARDDLLGSIFKRRYAQFIAGGDGTALIELLEQPQWNNPNVTDYYAFRMTTAATPGILAEHGVGWGADKEWLRTNIDGIATLWADVLSEFGNLMPRRLLVLDSSRQFSAPSAGHPDAAVWSAIYASEAPKAGIRAELAFAQAYKETGKFFYLNAAGNPPASGYNASWNNPAGLGVTGPAGVGNRFPSKLEGVRAHLQHLLWYVTADHTPYCAPLADQRHFGLHKGLGNDIRVLDGRWAQPGDGYGESIASIADSLPQPVPAPVLTPAQEAHRVFELAEAREAIVYVSRLQRGLDVERGDTFDPSRPPLDSRIKR